MKYAIVTGSTKGIGRAIAEALLEKGWFVFANYASDDKGAEEFTAANEAHKDHFAIVKCELRDYDSVAQFTDKILESAPIIDCVNALR